MVVVLEVVVEDSCLTKGTGWSGRTGPRDWEGYGKGNTDDRGGGVRWHHQKQGSVAAVPVAPVLLKVCRCGLVGVHSPCRG